MPREFDSADVPLVDVVGADANRRFGHIALAPEDQRPTVTFCDMGPLLRIWAYDSGDLTPQSARNLAAELTRWADWKTETRHA